MPSLWAVGIRKDSRDWLPACRRRRHPLRRLTPGAPGKEWFLQPGTVAEALRFALRLPPESRLEEVVLRSSAQAPEY